MNPVKMQTPHTHRFCSQRPGLGRSGAGARESACSMSLSPPNALEAGEGRPARTSGGAGALGASLDVGIGSRWPGLAGTGKSVPVCLNTPVTHY